MRNHGIDKCELTWMGLDFKEGLAEGSSISHARNGQLFFVKRTGMGKLVRSYNPDKSGTVTITVDTESKLHQQLIELALNDGQLRNLVDEMRLKDEEIGIVITFINAFIMTQPGESRATEASTSQWVFCYESSNEVPNTADQNVVGV
jgi:hypothetical protein